MIEAKNDIRVVGERAYIALKGGEVAVIDAADVELVSSYRWCADRQGHTTYVYASTQRPDGRHTTIYLHRLILNPPAGMHIDHANANGLDNIRENLSIVTPTANYQRRKDNTSGLLGVDWHKAAGKWRARIRVAGRHIHLGLFTNKLDAARAYDAAVLLYYPPGSLINFPETAAENVA